MEKGMGLLEQRIDETGFAVVDIETTGLSTKDSRIVEICVAHLDPSGETHVVLETLVDPEGPVHATEIHGITDEDVKGAPTFGEVLPAIEAALSGRVFVAHNVYFDYSFIRSQFEELGKPLDIPHLCTMYFGPLLGVMERCRLGNACRSLGIVHEHWQAHTARDDTVAAACLLQHYVNRCRDDGIFTFSELASRRSYKFLQSLNKSPLVLAQGGAISNTKLKPRRDDRKSTQPSSSPSMGSPGIGTPAAANGTQMPILEASASAIGCGNKKQ